jgi:hypothetical protein
VGQDVVTTTLAKVSRAERLKMGKPLPKAFELVISKQEDEADKIVVDIIDKEGPVVNNSVVIVDKEELLEAPIAPLQAMTTTPVEEEALIATQGIADRCIKYWSDSPKGSFEEEVVPLSSPLKVLEEERLGASTFGARQAVFARMGVVKTAAVHEQHFIVPRRNNAIVVATEDVSGVAKCGGNKGNFLMQDRCRSPVLDRAGSTLTEANEVRLSIATTPHDLHHIALCLPSIGTLVGVF